MAKQEPEQHLELGMYVICRHASESGKNGDLIAGFIIGFEDVKDKQGNMVPGVQLHNLFTNGTTTKELSVFRQKNYVVHEFYARTLLPYYYEVKFQEAQEQRKPDGKPLYENYGEWQEFGMKETRREAVRIYKALRAGQLTGYESPQPNAG